MSGVTLDEIVAPSDTKRDCTTDCEVPEKRPDVAMLQPSSGGAAGAAFFAAFRGIVVE